MIFNTVSPKFLTVLVCLIVSTAALPVEKSATKVPPSIVFAEKNMNDAEHVEWLKEIHEIRSKPQEYLDTHKGHAFYDMFKPSFVCPGKTVRLPGGLVDGGKWTCDMTNVTQSCLVYSIGSNGQYDFEREVLKFGCSVHTFDCTGDFGSTAPKGVTFHKWCVGGKDDDSKSFYTIRTMMDKLGHHRVDYLKMDVEGWEYEALPTLADMPVDRLPVQLGFEVHQLWPRNAVQKLQETIEFMQMLFKKGYRLISREDNFPHPCCSEMVYVLPNLVPR